MSPRHLASPLAVRMARLAIPLAFDNSNSYKMCVTWQNRSPWKVHHAKRDSASDAPIALCLHHSQRGVARSRKTGLCSTIRLESAVSRVRPSLLERPSSRRNPPARYLTAPCRTGLPGSSRSSAPTEPTTFHNPMLWPSLSSPKVPTSPTLGTLPSQSSPFYLVPRIGPPQSRLSLAIREPTAMLSIYVCTGVCRVYSLPKAERDTLEIEDDGKGTGHL